MTISPRIALTGAAAAFAIAIVMPLVAQPLPVPIIDVHMHASRADSQGPPPLAICPGQIDTLPTLQPGQAWPDTFIAHLKKPPCAHPERDRRSSPAVIRASWSWRARSSASLMFGQMFASPTCR